MRIPARLCALLVAALLAGCQNPFTPATPPPPAGAGVPENFATTDGLLETIALAMSARGVSGQTAYFDALADSTGPGVFAFYAFHAPGDVDAWHLQFQLDPPPVWSLTQEKPFFGSLGDGLAGLNFSFAWGDDNLSEAPPPPTETLAELHRHYFLSASSTDGSVEQIVAVGYANLFLQKVGSRWHLYRWEDRIDPAYGANPEIPNAFSMGRMRLNSYSR